MKFRPARSRRRGRIEIIPMIDVMFFLLATFMLASLAMQNLHSLAVDLPKGSAAPLQLVKPVTLTVTREGGLLLNETVVTLETLTSTLQAMLAGPETSVIVNADSAAPNGTVVQAMLRAREAGAVHFVFAIKRE
ncbi:MAG TPA: biopolymer transporter ExbD [Stellaceae bacterium]|nr:biopolymer transporter ExbD [Stellaceae bacterium]